MLILILQAYLPVNDALNKDSHISNAMLSIGGTNSLVRSDGKLVDGTGSLVGGSVSPASGPGSHIGIGGSLIGDLTSHANNIVSVTVNLSLAMPILSLAASGLMVITTTIKRNLRLAIAIAAGHLVKRSTMVRRFEKLLDLGRLTMSTWMCGKCPFGTSKLPIGGTEFRWTMAR